jgi:hypothetical protein
MVLDLMSAGVVNTTGIPQVVQQPRIHLARLGLDLNTAADNISILSKAQCLDIMRELLDIADELATKGDIV